MRVAHSTESMKMTTRTVLTIIALLIMLAIPVSLSAASYGTLVGEISPYSAVVEYGPHGYVKTISLDISTGDGIIWGIVCRRSLSNLGLCTDMMNNTCPVYSVSGTFNLNIQLEVTSVLTVVYQRTICITR